MALSPSSLHPWSNKVLERFESCHARGTEIIYKMYPTMSRYSVRWWIEHSSENWRRFKRGIRVVEAIYDRYSLENNYTYASIIQKMRLILPGILDEWGWAGLDGQLLLAFN